MQDDRRRQVLADYLDQRVLITGVLDRITINKNPAKAFKVALLQDVEVELSKAKYDLGHVWIQHAETLAELNYGDRLQCCCRVGQYKRTLPATPGNGATTKIDYSLSWPTDIKVLGRPIALSAAAPDEPGRNHTAAHPPAEPARPAEPPPEEPVKSADPVQLILQIKELAGTVGGVERIFELKGLMDKMGGWEQVLAIREMAEDVGGWERFEQLLSLLRL